MLRLLSVEGCHQYCDWRLRKISGVLITCGGNQVTLKHSWQAAGQAGRGSLLTFTNNQTSDFQHLLINFSHLWYPLMITSNQWLWSDFSCMHVPFNGSLSHQPTKYDIFFFVIKMCRIACTSTNTKADPWPLAPVFLIKSPGETKYLISRRTAAEWRNDWEIICNRTEYWGPLWTWEENLLEVRY